VGWQRLVCPQSVGLICNRGLQKQGYSIEGNSQFREPDNRCHPIGLSHDLPLPFPRPHVVFHIPTSGHAKQSLLFRHAAAPASPFLDMRSHTIQFSKNLRFFWLLSSDPTPRLRLFPPPPPSPSSWCSDSRRGCRQNTGCCLSNTASSCRPIQKSPSSTDAVS